jgi:rhamnogalacturonyl hydrolase YesR
MLDYLLHRAPKTDDGILYHNDPELWVWSDAAYMAPPFLAVAGQPREAIKQLEGFRARLLDPEKRLYSHIWDEEKQAFQRQDCWGVGNGWTAAGITRVIRALPQDMVRERQRLVGYAREVIDGCLAHQREDGLFHDIVDKPTTFVETNLAQMLAYSIYRGITGGWLDLAYREPADRMREAAHSKVDSYGLVQGVCGSPHFDHPGTATEGQAFFLLMETAHSDYLKSS